MRFTYNIDHVGDCYLTEDENIPAMFIMLRRYGMEQIDVQIELQDGSGRCTQQLNDTNSSTYPNAQTRFGDSPSNERVKNVNPLMPVSDGKHRLSASWSTLIESKGQLFPGGANEFRKSLIQLFCGGRV